MEQKLLAFIELEHPNWKRVQEVVDFLLTAYYDRCTLADLSYSLAIDQSGLDPLYIARCLNDLDIPNPRLTFLVARWCKEQIAEIREHEFREQGLYGNQRRQPQGSES